MTYSIKTTFPKEELEDNTNHKVTTTSRQEFLSDNDFEAVVDVYNEYLRQGYSINTSFVAPPDEALDLSPFEIAEQLTKAGIDYRATLKVKNSGSYDDIVKLAHLIEQHGYNFTMGLTLKINEDSPVNIDHENTWMDSDYAVYKVTPKAGSTDINELKDVYDQIQTLGYDVDITVKPKKPSADSETQEESFSAQLAAYPDNTFVNFTLTDA